jgi:hypothetical protein
MTNKNAKENILFSHNRRHLAFIKISYKKFLPNPFKGNVCCAL